MSIYKDFNDFLKRVVYDPDFSSAQDLVAIFATIWRSHGGRIEGPLKSPRNTAIYYRGVQGGPSIRPDHAKWLYTQKYRLLILVELTEIRLYSPFSDCFGTELNIVQFQINRERVNTISFWLIRTRINKINYKNQRIKKNKIKTRIKSRFSVSVSRRRKFQSSGWGNSSFQRKLFLPFFFFFVATDCADWEKTHFWRLST